MTTYAVTGATGKLGRLVIQELLVRGVSAGEVLAIVRSQAKAADLADMGVQAREADYTQRQRLREALEGVDRLLLISSSDAGHRAAHHANVIAAAVTAGVGHIAYTSMINLDDTTNPLAGEHRDTEQTLRDADVPFTSLRNGWYTENYTDQLESYLRSGEIRGAAGAGRVSAATRRDYAAAAAAVLLEDDSDGRVYELGGPSFDLTELARVIAEVTGTPVTYADLSADAYVAELRQAGLEQDKARFVAALDASIANGDLETYATDLERLLGRPATPLQDVVRAAHASL